MAQVRYDGHELTDTQKIEEGILHELEKDGWAQVHASELTAYVAKDPSGTPLDADLEEKCEVLCRLLDCGCALAPDRSHCKFLKR